jgi:hypothetical protein
MRRTEAALRQIQQARRWTPRKAPPNSRLMRPEIGAVCSRNRRERAQQLVAKISSQMLGELRTLREQIDDLMRDMNERRDLIREAIRHMPSSQKRRSSTRSSSPNR